MPRKARERGPFLWRRGDKVGPRDFYCYALMDPRKPGPFAYGPLYLFPYEPFYIGKGTGYRTSAHFTDAKEYRRTGVAKSPDDIPKYERILEIIDSGVSEKEFKKIGVVKWITDINEFESFEHEADAIRTIGRSLIHMGPLVNAIEGTQFTGGYQKISVGGFTGMNHVSPFSQQLSGTDKSGSLFASPRVILNSDVDPRGRLVRRGGRRKVIALENCRCLWSCPLCMLVVADEHVSPDAPLTSALFRVTPDRQTIRLCSIDLPAGDFIFATQIESVVMVSTKTTNFIFDPATNGISTVGFEVPEMPVLVKLPGEGVLPPGLYRVCLTTGDGSVYGAPSPYAEITLEEPGAIGVMVMDHVSGAYIAPSDIHDVWCTDADGEVFFRSLSKRTITDVSTMDPLKTFMTTPTPPMTHIARACGRLVGAVNNRLYFGMEYRHDLVNLFHFFEFSERIRMIAPVNATSGIGMYVGLESRTVYLSGANPSDMREFTVGAPVVEGTLAYCQNVPNLGNNIPAWVARDGVILGSPNGTISNTTVEKLKLLTGLVGASAFRMYNGSFQYIAAFKRDRNGSGVGFGDSATCDVVRNGKVI